MIFGALVAFIDIASDTLLISMEYLLGEHAFFTHRLVVTCGVTYCVILPLSLLRNIDQLEKASYAAVGILVAFTGCMVVNGIYLALNRYASQEGQKVEYFQADTDFLEGISIIALAYTAQANIFPIFLQLRMRSELRMRTVVRAAMALVSVAYWFGGFFGYMGYLDVTEGDVLNNLPESAFWSAWRLLVCVAIILHYPIVHFGLRTSIENSVFTGQSFSWKRHIMMTMVVVTCSMIAAIIMPGLDVIVAFTGAVAGFPLMFVFPCLFYIKSHTRDGHIKASIRPLVKTDQKVEGAYGAVPSEDLEDTTTEGLVPDAAWEYTFCAVMAFFSIGLTVVATGYTSYKIVTKFAEAEVE
jgi:sodium-coupled neutral amino acid transporter 11